jgi:hypothetical protein
MNHRGRPALRNGRLSVSLECKVAVCWRLTVLEEATQRRLAIAKLVDDIVAISFVFTSCVSHSRTSIGRRCRGQLDMTGPGIVHGGQVGFARATKPVSLAGIKAALAPHPVTVNPAAQGSFSKPAASAPDVPLRSPSWRALVTVVLGTGRMGIPDRSAGLRCTSAMSGK